MGPIFVAWPFFPVIVEVKIGSKNIALLRSAKKKSDGARNRSNQMIVHVIIKPPG